MAAVGSVAATHFGISHLVFTYTASSCVPDLQAKIRDYLSSPHAPDVTRYHFLLNYLGEHADFWNCTILAFLVIKSTFDCFITT